MNRTGQRIVFELRNRLFDHLLRLPVSWYDRHAVGWTVTRSTSGACLARLAFQSTPCMPLS